MSKRIAILGSTGSIGTNALEVIAHLGAPYQAIALSARKNTDLLLEQVRQHKPACVALADNGSDDAAIAEIRRLGTRIYKGIDGLTEMVQRDDVDLVLAAIVGAAGLPAVLAAVDAGKTLALANKEALVVAGSLVMPEARKRNVKVLPVDSEHSAIFQAIHCGRRDEIKKIILTASGGPFLGKSKNEIASATVEQALAHPTWRMGNKVTIDSATLFNKGLELIEACWLFDIPPSMVQVVVHPESIIHSMVEFNDGSVIAQLSPPDMRTPIQYALTYPERASGISRKMDWSSTFSMNFQPPDLDRFPGLAIAYEVAERGGTSGAVMNAANEVAVDAFMTGKIRFGRIPEVVRQTLDRHRVQLHPSLDDLLEADRWARETAGANL
ncbi:MAG TPA: 1-deoxy-D-xylulose-5-phosphate reductoisomerase [Tepidisphaeraceae bacterium]